MPGNATRPRVSVGLPVHNGDVYIREAIDSVLAQSFADFELIISDNCSTDRTQSICRQYACRDPRIRCYRVHANRGASWNFNYVASLARGKYFKWMAHDDVIAPGFLLKCAEVLDADESVVLCYTRAADIDSNGRLRKYRRFDLNISDPRPHKRLHDLICNNHHCFAVFGVMRLAVLRRIATLAAYPGSDRALLAELGLMGRFHEIEEVLFMHREHELRSTRASPVLQQRIGWFDPAKDGRMNFPNWRLLAEYAKCVRRAGLPSRERVLCYAQLLPWLTINRRLLAGDLAYAGQRLLKRRKEPLQNVECSPRRPTATALETNSPE